MRVIKKKKNRGPNCRVLPIRENFDFALLGRTGNILKSKTTAKLRGKKPRSHYEHLPFSRPPFFLTSGFWPRVRARALRAPVFLGPLKRQTGAARPPPSQLRCSPKNKKINYFQKQNVSLQALIWAARDVRKSFYWVKLHPNELHCTLLSYDAPS
jgi:hypothetical protein